MPRIDEQVIELTHLYNNPVDMEGRMFLHVPSRYYTVNKLYQLLPYIMFTFESLIEDVMEDNMMEDILVNVYKFSKPEVVGHFIGFDLYTIRESQCGRFVTDEYDCEFDYVKLVEYIESKLEDWGIEDYIGKES